MHNLSQPLLLAMVGMDYVELQEELVFPPDVMELQFQFTVLDDEIVEDRETVRLLLVAAEGETGVLFPEGGVIDGEILDDNDSKRKDYHTLKLSSK